MNNTIIIGLTGPTGAGKSALRDIFAEYGCRYIDCDVLSRKAVEPGSPALELLAESFGRDILRPDGTLDRAALARRAFPTEEGRALLNSIVHPEVIRLLEQIVSECRLLKTPGVVIDAPLLFEAGLDKRCDTVIAVTAPDDQRLRRIMSRDGISEAAARLRMAAQHDCSYYSEKSEYTITNDSTFAQLLDQAHSVLDNVFKGDSR